MKHSASDYLEFYHDAHHLGVEGLRVDTIGAAIDARQTLDDVLDRVMDRLTYYGALASRLEQTSANLLIETENTIASESVIRDADMAREMVEYTRSSLLANVAQSMLAHANQESSQVIGLLQ